MLIMHVIITIKLANNKARPGPSPLSDQLTFEFNPKLSANTPQVDFAMLNFAMLNMDFKTVL